MTTPRRALILVDVQQEYFAGPLEIQFPPHGESLPRITAAIDAAVAAGIPIVAVQHANVQGAPAFDPTTDGFALHPDVQTRLAADVKRVIKRYASVFADTDLRAWLRANDVDTITLVGYMTNNCIIASAAEAAAQGLRAEVLADATGAIHIAHSAGFADAETVHTTLITVLHSNFAAVASTQHWIEATRHGEALERDNLLRSARSGAERAAQPRVG